MVIKYDFEADYMHYNAKYDEEYWGTEEYEFEIDLDDQKEVAIKMVMDDVGCDKETAKKFVDEVLWNYDLLEDYLQANIDFVKDYFEEQAKREFLRN